MIEKIFLGVVGTAYLVLAIWCMIAPGTTAQAVGFELQSGSGQSEYLVVYGGLQLGLGCFFIWPVFWKPEVISVAIVASLFIHTALVLLRSVSFLLYEDLGGTTLVLASVEWSILISTLLVWRHQQRKQV